MEVKESPTPNHLLSKLTKSPWTLPIVVSVALVIPCFWQPIVSGSDLQSHLYNAWSAELIRGGNIQGLWIGHQSTNVLVDMLLSLLLKGFGVSGAERVCYNRSGADFLLGRFLFHLHSSRPRGLLAGAMARYPLLRHGIPSGTDELLPLMWNSFLVICHLMAAALGMADAMGYASAPSVLSRASSARRLDFVRGDLLLACSADAGSFSASSFLG
jgi:hypothetical protein